MTQNPHRITLFLFIVNKELCEEIQIAQKMNERQLIEGKKVLTFKEACQYTGYKASYLHKLTASRRIPFSKPTGKKIYFDRDELDSWLMSKRIATIDEITAKAMSHGR